MASRGPLVSRPTIRTSDRAPDSRRPCRHRRFVRGGYGITYFPGNIASLAYMKNAPLFSLYGPVISNGTLLGGAPNLFLDDGLPPPPPAPPIDPQNLSGAFRAVDLNFKSTRVQQFNVQAEREFAGNVMTFGYVGSRGDHVAMNPDINQAPA